MDSTLSQILSYLYQVQAEAQRLATENAELKRRLEAVTDQPKEPGQGVPNDQKG